MTGQPSAERFLAILARMAELAAGDAELCRAVKGKSLVLWFAFTDLDAAFFTRFAGGACRAGVGTADDADLRVSIRSAVFDAVFSGERPAADAFLHGDLSVAGNMAVAMRLQGLLRPLKRLYQQAKGALDAAA